MNSRGLAIGLFLLLIATQILLSRRIDRTNPIPEYDEAVYADLAREWVRTGKPLRRLGEEPRFYYIHPYLQTLIWSVPIRGNVAAEGMDPPDEALSSLSRMRWMTTFFAVATACLLFLVALLKFDPIVALIATSLLVLDPMWLRYGHLVYLEVPVALGILCSLAAWDYVWRARSWGRGSEPRFLGKPAYWFLASGLFAGAAAITKYTSLVWWITVLILMVWSLYRGYIRYQEVLIWALGAFAVSITWPLFILWRGSLSDWITGSLGRWTSFRVGQGGDPRTEWGALDLLSETAHEIGIVHSALLGVGLLLFLLLLTKGRPRRTAQLSGKDQEGEKGGTLPVHSLYLVVFLVVWLLAATKDPKFIVMVLPSVCLIAAHGWIRFFRTTPFSRLPRPLIGLSIVPLILLGFPVDLLRLDDTSLKKLYPTDQAYTRTCLPHGADYRPIAQRLSEITEPRGLIVVGRQGPIPAYLADRPYALLYTHRDPSTVREILEKSEFVLIDDTWENCLAGLDRGGIREIRRTIEKDFQVEEESGRVRLLRR